MSLVIVQFWSRNKSSWVMDHVLMLSERFQVALADTMIILECFHPVFWIVSDYSSLYARFKLEWILWVAKWVFIFRSEVYPRSVAFLFESWILISLCPVFWCWSMIVVPALLANICLLYCFHGLSSWLYVYLTDDRFFWRFCWC